MVVYCLFCETAKCDAVVRDAERLLGCAAISPKQIQHTWSRGKMVDFTRDLLPGYVFLYAQDGPLEIERVQSIAGVIRCLCSMDRQFELTGSDEQFALMLLRNRGVIGKTKVYEEGQRIRICEGAFEGVEASILKVNRQKKRMLIELPFASAQVKTWVEFDIVNACEGA